MQKFIHLAVAYWVTAPTILREKRESGASTMEAVIWIGGLAIIAVGAIVLITAIINGWIAKIPT